MTDESTDQSESRAVTNGVYWVIGFMAGAGTLELLGWTGVIVWLLISLAALGWQIR